METVKIEKGELIVDENTITIIDDAKKQNNVILFSAIAWTVFGILSILRYFEGEDVFLLWTGILIGVGHLVVALNLLLFNSNASVIPRAQIVSVKLKNRFGNEFVAIKLSNGRVRKIKQLSGNSEEVVESLKMGASTG